jgi:single-strand DNA-binding protein
MSYATVIVCGNVGRDAEYRTLPAGGGTAEFSVATNERWTDRAGKKQEKTSWHNISCFGSSAEIARDYVKKGRLVLVEGALDYQEWSDKEGHKRNRTVIKAMRLVLLGGNRRETGEQTELTKDEDDVPF